MRPAAHRQCCSGARTAGRCAAALAASPAAERFRRWDGPLAGEAPAPCAHSGDSKCLWCVRRRRGLTGVGRRWGGAVEGLRRGVWEAVRSSHERPWAGLCGSLRAGSPFSSSSSLNWTSALSPPLTLVPGAQDGLPRGPQRRGSRARAPVPVGRPRTPQDDALATALRGRPPRSGAPHGVVGLHRGTLLAHPPPHAHHLWGARGQHRSAQRWREALGMERWLVGGSRSRLPVQIPACLSNPRLAWGDRHSSLTKILSRMPRDNHRHTMTFSNRDLIEASFAMRLVSLRIWLPAGFLDEHCWGLRWAELGGHQAPRPSTYRMRARAVTSASWFENLLQTMINTLGGPPSSRHRLRHLARLWLLTELELGRTEVESMWGACAWGREADVMSVRDKDCAFNGFFALSSASDRLYVHFWGWCHRPDELLPTPSQMPPGMVFAKKTWSRRRWDGELVRLSASAFVHKLLEFLLSERWSTLRNQLPNQDGCI